MNNPRTIRKPMSLDAVIDQALQQPPVTVVAESGAVTQVHTEPAGTDHSAAEKTSEAGQGRAPKQAWDEADPRIIHYFQVRMPEPLKLKLEWLEIQMRLQGERTGKGLQHKIVLTSLEKEINKLIAKALKHETITL